MQKFNNLNQNSHWGACAVLIVACFGFIWLGTHPATAGPENTTTTASSGLVISLSSDEIATAVSMYFEDEVTLELVRILAVKITSHFHISAADATDFATWIVHASDQHDVNPILLASIIATESSFRQNVVSHKGAIGPAQIIPKYWEKFCAPLDLNVPRDNIECGARILSHLVALCDGDESCAIQSYNMGFSRVQNGKKLECVERYQRKVEQFKDLFGNCSYQECDCQKCVDCFHIVQK
ncbi:MAG: lytic transglycosylase domain-containing protein [Gammaproteobacteria bacterium]|nr:lytic transglycosylase domain-containing protein [Gammaproteobacteria bacterium]MYF01675.1 lytic transglycosylase domain-containing protein [Gammaproteobacteria bacterium]MYI76806.1 lytic transglycosylase domain-containing protein [Gammaproteobacteria bacterium]